MDSRRRARIVAAAAARTPLKAATATALSVLTIVAAAPSAVSSEAPGAFATGDPSAKPSTSNGLHAALAAGKKQWLFGRLSHTYEQKPVSQRTQISTIEQVGYKVKRNASWPRVGDVYLGSIWVARTGDDTAGDEVVTEVIKPRKTAFAINKSHHVRCFTGDADGAKLEIKGRKCPNRPSKGAYGAEFSPPKGSWHVPSRHWVQVIFPLRSSAPLRGLVGPRNACLMGAVKNLSGYRVGRLWDAPVGGENCPTASGHGPYQSVFVARRR